MRGITLIPVYIHTEVHNFISQGECVDWFDRHWDWGDHEMGG